ncbi:unnamed protein product [Brachionus calyciflorus]|uniref:Protein farnesyltransferase/geranylgeranyltransferase type-1 subunit alpha n=1 Tax=Brachionus calyciflorus TaxID=104777 RepID=A0A813MM88_9BILA|nr:unnamed protein product [Brachionus calyciflorus]
MSDSSDESVDLDVSYSQRPEWSDITPITQDEESNQICRIAYTENFKEVFGYFRAILKISEKSERAFDLTKDAALLNPANYTVWYYRRILLKELNKDLHQELEFITKVIRSNPKNYQVWQHRRCIIELLQEPDKELNFTEEILKRDSKNYHAWQYRQWVIKTFALWDNELDYVNDLITVDVRNNSAWNQRYFYLSNKYDLTQENEILNREIDFCLEKINFCIDNESSWNYLRAVIDHLIKINENNYPQKVLEFCNIKLSTGRDDDMSPFLLSFKIDFNWFRSKEMLKKLESNNDDVCLKQNIRTYANESLDYLTKLAIKYDTIRANYWNYLASNWKQEFGQYTQ